MTRRLLLPALAIIGMLVAIAATVVGDRANERSVEVIPRLQSPYVNYVAGVGLVEAGTGNINVGSPVAGVVAEIYIKAGDKVNVGDPLFRIDDRDLRAALVSADANIEVAAAAMLQPEHKLTHAEQLRRKDPGAISEQDFDDLRDQLAAAKTLWELRKAQSKQLAVEIERHTVRAPLSGQVLQLNMHLGEFVDASTAAQQLLFGSTTPLRVRVNIDEHDAWRFRPGFPATAIVRGQPQLKVPLSYDYTEPLVVPKQSLTGSGTEKVDTRVLQVLYKLARTDFPLYAGQQLDVFVDAPPTDTEPEVR